MGRRPHSIPKGPDIVQNDRTFSACPGYRAPVAFQKNQLHATAHLLTGAGCWHGGGVHLPLPSGPLSSASATWHH